MDYKQEVKLKHTESLFKMENSTGELIPVKKRPNNMPDTKEKFEPNAKFTKSYHRSWRYLKTVLNDTEYRIVHEMSLLAKISTNSLEPLNNETSVVELSEKFHISRPTTYKVFKKLKELGVYAEVDVTTIGGDQHFWILNPYISFNGGIINKSLIEIFEDTIIAIAFKSL